MVKRAQGGAMKIPKVQVNLISMLKNVICFSQNCFSYKCLLSWILGNQKTQTWGAKEELDAQVCDNDYDKVCDSNLRGNKTL